MRIIKFFNHQILLLLFLIGVQYVFELMQRKSRKNAGRGEKASRSRSRSKKIHCNNSHPRYFLKNDILKTMKSNAVDKAKI